MNKLCGVYSMLSISDFIAFGDFTGHDLLDDEDGYHNNDRVVITQRSTTVNNGLNRTYLSLV